MYAVVFPVTNATQMACMKGEGGVAGGGVNSWSKYKWLNNHMETRRASRMVVACAHALNVPVHSPHTGCGPPRKESTGSAATF